MNERNPSGRAVLWTIMAGVATLILLVGGYIANNSNSSATGNGTTGVVAVADCRVMAAHYVQMAKGFTPDQYVVGKIDASQPGVSANRGGAFSNAPVTTKAELRKQLNANTAQAKAVIADVQQQVSSKVTVADVKNVNNWVSVQYKVAVVWPDNTTFVGGKEKAAGQLDNGLVGEVSWIFVSKKGCAIAKATLVSASTPADVTKETASKRGACLNGKSHPKPKPPNPTPTPTPTPTPSPSCPPNMPHGHWPICKDDPSHDPIVNPSVPDQVKGPGTGVTGPPSTPTDGPCGITTCPTATPKPTPPSGGGPTTLPSPTTSPSPASDAPSPSAPASGTPGDF
jgi:hypothetical protein